MDLRKCTSPVGVPSLSIVPPKFSIKFSDKSQIQRDNRQSNETEADVDLREVYFLFLHFLSSGPCKRTFAHFSDELLEHQLLPRRYHSWFSRGGADNEGSGDNGISFPLSYAELAERHPHIEKDHMVKLLKQLMISASSSLNGKVGRPFPNAADVPTLLGTGSFSLLDCDKNMENSQAKPPPAYLHWPHMQAGQVHAIGLREIGGGFTKHHRAPSTRSACYAIAKPSTLLQKMQNIKKLRGHRNAVYCAIFDRSGRYVITGSDDRLVKVWSMETALCLASCRGHEGDITDLAVSSNNAVVASASNDFVIRVWRLPDGMPVSVLQGHTGAVTAIAFSPRPNAAYHLLSSSDDGTCRIWEARFSHLKPKIYQPKPSEPITGKSNVSSNNGASSTNGLKSHQILCCAYNADGTVFVTGSSDTFARVWSALRSNTDDPERPMHEMDVLSGHEDDVNYVQFSGCPVATKSSLSDSWKEESIPKFKNSWFSHDNIVTCSRDGSAIIWVPRSRRSHGKVGRWTRAYHLKVPPPPLPPQPARGGPRQRFLPTPRGVNMIVWSLDNRFVLAAIMDCRICVWNAVDGSLVHSLTGHTASSYVLDVHPFNTRIAMSAGYDGRTIVWDIWEGTPIRIYSMGDFKLVDGKFSADGTSIVLSDDVGQIYLINTGEGELQKDAKYDQFFLGDYRPVLRDTTGGVLDQETQLPPHQRNIQDPLCDSSLMPYPEPYQTQYQQRRLGALGIEWRPSSMKMAVGPEISLGLDYLMAPLPDLERTIDPLPEFVDAAFWEPEVEVLSEDNDSEYNAAEETSEGEKERSISSSTSDSEFSAEDDNNDGLRRSRRKKHVLDSATTSSGRRIKKRNLDETAGTSSASHKNKKPKTNRRVSKRKSSKATTLRPKRLAACNARNMLSQISGTSSEGEIEFETEHDSSDSDVVILDSEHEPSDTEIVIPKTKSQSHEPSTSQNHATEKDPSSNEIEETAMASQTVESQPNPVKKGRRLVLKFSLRDKKKEVLQEDPQPKCDRESDSVPAEEKRTLKFSVGSRSSSAEATDAAGTEISEKHNEIENSQFGQPETEDLDCKQFGNGEFENFDENGTEEFDSLDYGLKCSLKESLDHSNEVSHSKHSSEGPSMLDYSNETSHSKNSDEKEKALCTSTKFRIKTKRKILADPGNPSKLKFVARDDEMERESSPTHSEEDLDFPDTFTEAVRRTRSLNIKATSREANLTNHRFRVKGNNNHQEARSSRGSEESSRRNVFDQVDRRSRTARNQRSQNNNGYDQCSSSLALPVGKISWLTLSQYEDGYRYIPQLGDEVVYLRQGHEEFAEVSGSRESLPRSLKSNMSAVEVCRVETLDYTWVAGSGESCCKIKLKFTDPSSNVFGKSFSLTLPELKDFSDFVVERALYDSAVNRNWTNRDKCFVWWRSQNGEGGEWWGGRVVAAQPKSPEFPESPWLRYQVRYNEDSTQTEQHNPWELCDSPYQVSWDRPRIDPETQKKLLKYFAKLEDKEYQIILQMNNAVRKSDYCNRLAAPFYPELIKSRINNNYYRSLEALKNDLRVMFSNAESYFTRRESTARIASISQWFTKKLSRLF